MVRRELRMKRHSHQSALAARLDVIDHRERLCKELPVFDDADSSRAFGHEHPTIGSKHDRPGNLKTSRDRLDAKPHCTVRCGSDFTTSSRWRLLAGDGNRD